MNFNKKKNMILYIIFILFLLFVFFYVFYITTHKFLLKQETFINNPNYCRSKNGNFIYITNPDDIRCLKNQNKKINKNYLSGKGNCFENNSWGIYHNNTCYTFNNLFSKFYNMNYLDYINQALNLNNISSEEEENQDDVMNKIKSLRLKNKKKRECNSQRLPNSTPCFELFENSSTCTTEQLNSLQSIIDDTDNPVNLDQECKNFKKDNNFGFYQPLCISGQVSYDCRKYYKSNDNKVISSDNIPLYGTYQPNFYIPLKSDNTPNLTGCFEKSLDFNDLCSSINNNQLYGAYKILNGADGNCYQDNGLEDKTKSNAYCSQNFYNERPIEIVKDGYLTNCLPNFSNFTQECKNIITNNNDFDIEAYDVNSYDCPPNKARAKCRLNEKINN